MTAVLIGADTWKREYVDYEIQKSIARGNGLLGINISGLKDIKGNTSVQGRAPQALLDAGAPIYAWNREKFGEWVEAAAKKAGQ